MCLCMVFIKKIKKVSRPRIYENLGRNPGITYWQIRHPVTINMFTSYWIVSLVA
jgi:hypothetical protein